MLNKKAKRGARRKRASKKKNGPSEYFLQFLGKHKGERLARAKKTRTWSRKLELAKRRAPKKTSHRGTARGGADADLVSALKNLGYKNAEQMARGASGSSFDEKIRSVLKRNPRPDGYRFVRSETRKNRRTGRLALFEVQGGRAKRVGTAPDTEAEARKFLRANPRGVYIPGVGTIPAGEARLRYGYRTTKQAKKGQRRALEQLEKGARKAQTSARPKANGRRPTTRRNGAETEAAALYEKFHGKASKEVLEFLQEQVTRKDYAALGDLESIDVKTPAGDVARITFGPRQQMPLLAASPKGGQLYCIGGNQDIGEVLRKLGCYDLAKDFVDVGEAKRVEYIARKSMDAFNEVHYYHKLGEETGERPRLVFDRLNRRIALYGGAYHVEAPGIMN